MLERDAVEGGRQLEALARRAQGGERLRAELQAACEGAQQAARQRGHEVEQLRRKLEARARKVGDAEAEARQAHARTAELAAALETAEREGASLQAEAARLGEELGAASRKAAELEKAVGAQQAEAQQASEATPIPTPTPTLRLSLRP